MTIDTELKNLNQTSPLIELYTLDCSLLRDSTGTPGAIYRFTPHYAEGGKLRFRGVDYDSMPITSSGWDISSSGTQPRPSIAVSNVTKVLLHAIINLGDIVGATVTRIRTYEKFLDDKPTADSTQYMKPDVFQVEQKTSHTNTQVSFQLTSVLERFGSKLPRRQALKDQSTAITVGGVTFDTNLYTPGISRYRGNSV